MSLSPYPAHLPCSELVDDLLATVLSTSSSRPPSLRVIDVIRPPSTCTSLVHIHSLVQIGNGSCGYFTLHNLLSFDLLPDSHSSVFSKENLLYVSSVFQDQTSFWRRYFYLVRALLRKGGLKVVSDIHDRDEDRYYPWDRETILSGILERNYASYVFSDEFLSSDLSDVHPELYDSMRAIQQHICLVRPYTLLVPNFSESSFGNAHIPADEIVQIESAFNRLRDPTSTMNKILIIVGAHIHFFGIAIHRILLSESLISSDDSPRFELVILNSHPYPFFRTSDEVRKGILDDWDSYSRRKHPDWDESLISQKRVYNREMLESMATSVEIFLSLISDGDALRRHYADSLYENVMASFVQHAEEILQRDSTCFDDPASMQLVLSEWELCLSSWLAHVMHPLSLKYSTLPIIRELHLADYISLPLRQRLIDWMQLLVESCRDTLSSADEIVEVLGGKDSDVFKNSDVYPLYFFFHDIIPELFPFFHSDFSKP